MRAHLILFYICFCACGSDSRRMILAINQFSSVQFSSSISVIAFIQKYCICRFYVLQHMI
jgi:hypothetical protein